MSFVLEGQDATALSLMQAVLRDGEPLAPEYPLVFEDGFPGRIVPIGEGDDVRSACGILARDFLALGTRVRGGLIGSVATDPDWRRLGLATHVLVAAEAALELEGCAFALLWTQSPEFYLRRGYGPVGSQLDFIVPSELAESLPSSDRARPRTPDDTAVIHELYAQHRVRVDRTLDETGALLDCPGMCTLVLERGDAVVAYACMGRGADLVDSIHEWGGDAPGVLALVRAHLERRFGKRGLPGTTSGSLVLMAPGSATELTRSLEELGLTAERSMLGLGKILDRTAAAEVMTRVLAPQGSVSVDPSPDAARFVIRGPKQSGRVDDDGALALLIGVEEVRADVASLLAELGFDEASLPIEPFAWGLDSI